MDCSAAFLLFIVSNIRFHKDCKNMLKHCGGYTFQSSHREAWIGALLWSYDRMIMTTVRYLRDTFLNLKNRDLLYASIVSATKV
jgi:hypothetical protein